MPGIQGLLGLGALSQGMEQAQQDQYKKTLQALALREATQKIQQNQQQQQAQSAIGNLLSSGGLNQLGGGMGGQPPPGSIPPTQGQPPQGQPPQAPQMGGGMGQPPPGGGVKGSWFGNAPGWQDSSDSGLQANGQPVSAGPGIALPSRGGLGQNYNVTTPDGRTFQAPQTDVGPAARTGRGVDINAMLAKQMGYSPGNFPTDQVFKVALANTDPQTQALAHVSSQQTVRQIPGIGQTVGRWDMDGLATLIDKTNPDLDPSVKAAVFLKMAPLLSTQAKEQAAQVFEQYKFGVEESDKQTDFGIRQSELQQQRADTNAFRRQSLALQGKRVEQAETRAPAGQQALQKFLQEHPDATAEQIQQFNQEGHVPRSGPAAAVQKYMQENPNATSEDIAGFVAKIGGQVSTTTAFDRGKQGDTVRSINVAVDHLGVLQDAANALQSGQVRVPNQIANAIATQLGSPAPTDFAATKAIVKDEMVKAVLGGVGALGDRQSVESTIDAASSPEQLSGVIKRYEQLMGGQMRGLQQQFTSSGAGSAEDFDKKLFPRTQQAIKGAGQPGAPSGADFTTMTLDQLKAIPQDDFNKMSPDQHKAINDRLLQLTAPGSQAQ